MISDPGSGCLEAPPRLFRFFIEKIGKLPCDCTAELFDIGNRHRTLIVAGDIMADPDRQKLNG